MSRWEMTREVPVDEYKTAREERRHERRPRADRADAKLSGSDKYSDRYVPNDAENEQFRYGGQSSKSGRTEHSSRSRHANTRESSRSTREGSRHSSAREKNRHSSSRDTDRHSGSRNTDRYPKDREDRVASSQSRSRGPSVRTSQDRPSPEPPISSRKRKFQESESTAESRESEQSVKRARVNASTSRAPRENKNIESSKVVSSSSRTERHESDRSRTNGSQRSSRHDNSNNSKSRVSFRDHTDINKQKSSSSSSSSSRTKTKAEKEKEEKEAFKERMRKQQEEMIAKAKAKKLAEAMSYKKGKHDDDDDDDSDSDSVENGSKDDDEGSDVDSSSDESSDFSLGIDSTPPKEEDEMNKPTAEDDFEALFADSPSNEVTIKRQGDDALVDNFDDDEGYYKLHVGELINNRYKVLGINGKGVYSTVAVCDDIQERRQVAIKMLRNKDEMKRAGEKELEFLKTLKEKDPRDDKHCIRLHTSFDYKNHLCLVFEKMSINLRESLKKFGRNVGIRIDAVRVYAKQMLVGLHYMKKLKILHCDLKPDNVMVNDKWNIVKICDFGTAVLMGSGDDSPTPYRASRFYRAPEIILGLQIGPEIDMWSFACIVYELYTGKYLFAGRSSNEMLKLFQDLKGRFPNRIVKRHLASYEMLEMEAHFTEDYKFKHVKQDGVTKRDVLHLVDYNRPIQDLTQMIMTSKNEKGKRDQMLDLCDFLNKSLIIDPSKRLSVEEALQHPFIIGRMKQSGPKGPNMAVLARQAALEAKAAEQ
eukprot:TRINITY_DN13_c0_g3_i1.p1 TRINITY_DN13_c0_g3~~TRINITY_DN13_c0_g3_i1.p1  ORF type:complete len:762 (-),score=243.15 TRINITY_DN13_c0_g3_i1:110-2395(-)